MVGVLSDVKYSDHAVSEVAGPSSPSSPTGQDEIINIDGPPRGMSTALDKRDMWRMGKIQDLRRYFGPWAILGFASILGCAWEYALITVIWSLPNGGPAGAAYMFLACIVGLFLSTLSLAEMSSMAPSAGGQYHWISEFAPRSIQELLSYLVGWLTVLGWQVGLASVSYAAAVQLEGLAILVNPSITFEGWHATLFTIAIALVAVLFNTVLVEKLPVFEFIILILHVAAYIAFEVVLLAMGPQSSRKEVFEQWNNENGWPNLSTAVLIGIIAPVTTLTSADSICHLAEELKDASKWLPRCMVGAAALNFSISFLMLLTVLFRAGDIEAAINSPTGQPYIEILLNATGSVTGTAIMVAYIILSLMFCVINMVTTSSRQLYSFARDGGLPFSRFFSKVSSRNMIPMNAVCATLVFTVILSLVLIGSSLAFNIIASLGAAAILGSYLISISCITYRKLTCYQLPTTRFPLGKLGLPINILALCFLSLAFVLVFFPAAPNPTPESMNWVSLIFGSVMLLALVMFVVKKRHEYTGPVVQVRREEEWNDTELDSKRMS
ncbi:Choline transport protein [Pseudocercospora fuligena]|uniref:Choline transport protein n=1 Tax=Pseudocercospora fuligena TaxID=685502 RepID=A0A8H6RSV6_9PEZI|nr:Choline transport protein [Pseudocercospora fuligena]